MPCILVKRIKNILKETSGFEYTEMADKMQISNVRQQDQQGDLTLDMLKISIPEIAYLIENSRFLVLS